MTHLDIEIKRLNNEAVDMFNLVISQMEKASQALFNLDKGLASEVTFNEKRVNALELKIDKDCENIFALMTPVAIDLRFVLAVLKINYNLERIGDIADGIARYVMDSTSAFEARLLENTRLHEMYDMAIEMLKDVKEAFESEKPALARNIFQKDNLLDEINGNANAVIENYIRENPDKIASCLHIISTIRKLERTGDQIKNIAEEIIFFIEAKVLKHTTPKTD